jgi:hypothetical protein
MTEPLPIEPAHGAGVAPAPAPQPAAATANAAPQQPLEQPVPQPVLPPQSRFNTLTAILGGIVLVGMATAALGFAFWYVNNVRGDNSGTKAGQQNAASEISSKQPTSDSAPPTAADVQHEQEVEQRRLEAAAKRREDAARRQGQVIAFKLQGKKTQQELDDLLAAATNWQTKVETLLDGADGRRLAASAPHVERFVAVYDKKRLTKSEIATLQSRLDVLQQPLKSAEKDGDAMYVPSQTLRDDLQTLRSEITAAQRQYKQDLLAVSGLLESTASAEPSKDTLKTAIAAFHRGEAARRAAAVAEARRKAGEDADRKLAAAEAAKVAAEARVKLLKIQAGKAEAESKEKSLNDEIQAAAKKREAARKKAVLVRQFQQQYPAMRGYLTPFTSSGYAQPGRYGFVRTTEKGPVSLSKLQGMGFLKKTIGSLQSFYYSTTANRMNDRPSGAFPQYVGGASDWARKQETVQTVQDFLNKFGTIMVEKKLLAP